MNTGSKPNPLSPRGGQTSVPSTLPTNSTSRPSGWARQSVALNEPRRARRRVGARRLQRVLDPPHADHVVAPALADEPAQSAVYTPGWPPIASTQSPESSASAIVPDAFAAACALIRAFSSNVVPVSSGSGSPSSRRRDEIEIERRHQLR